MDHCCSCLVGGGFCFRSRGREGGRDGGSVAVAAVAIEFIYPRYCTYMGRGNQLLLNKEGFINICPLHSLSCKALMEVILHVDKSE